MFKVLAVEAGCPPEVLSKFQELVGNARTLEQLFFFALSNHYSLKLCAPDGVREDSGLFVSAAITTSGRSGYRGPVGALFIPINELKGRYPLKTLKGKYSALSDQPHFYPNPEWYNSRNKKLKIREFGEYGELAISPAGLVELVLTYALTPFGVAEMKWELLEDQRNRITACGRLDLMYLGNEVTTGWQETIYVVLSKLAGLRAVTGNVTEKREVRVER